ncbi:MAG: cobalamin-dependent protein [Candidatus Hydromicrobium sp.]
MKKILGACVGSCVHVAGILNFLNLASKYDYSTKFLGSACTIDRLKKEIEKYNPDVVAISYRLSPESALPILKEFKEKIIEKLRGVKIEFILGGTKPVAEVAKKLGIFDVIFTGEESIEEIESYLNKKKVKICSEIPPQSLLERIKYRKPFPVIRHHFGRPTLNETLEGIKRISLSGLVDVISIGPDQNTQEFFFHPEKMDIKQNGAGGVPLRSEKDFKSLYLASRTGNYPLLRCYSGTNEIIKMAKVLLDNINNAWCAVPLCWYNELDNRSERKVEESIAENQSVMKWHGQRDVPVEVNESHHWSLRYSPDSIAVAAAYIAAYNAKMMGVKVYISQYMFNTPPETSFIMDLAKMLAKVELVESLHDKNFTTIRQTRSGLYSYPTDFDKGKGQLASSTLLQMQLDPDIVHVVAYCEADHAAKPEDIIESVKITKKVIENYLYGCPDMKLDERVGQRKEELIADAKLIIDKIKKLDKDNKYKDPLISPAIISKAIKIGVLDAPHLRGVKAAKGAIRTMFIDGKNLTVDQDYKPVSEKDRLGRISEEF